MNKFHLEFEKPIVELYSKIDDLQKLSDEEGNKDLDDDIAKLILKAEKLREKIYANLEPIQIVQVARHPERPLLLDYVQHCMTDYIELHGDRCFGDDKALIGGFAKIDGEPVMVIGQQRGKNTKENIYRNFGMPQPEGYRKALRLMKLAEKFKIPIISLVDVQGAYPGLSGEERGVAEAIAKNLEQMMGLKVPVIVVVIGEGGSGGALGIAIGNRVAMLKYSIYSVISPEGCAAILWRDAAMSPVAAQNLGITSDRLKSFDIIDDIIDEPVGGAHADPDKVYKKMSAYLKKELKRYADYSPERLQEDRYQRFRKLGRFSEV